MGSSGGKRARRRRLDDPKIQGAGGAGEGAPRELDGKGMLAGGGLDLDRCLGLMVAAGRNPKAKGNNNSGGRQRRAQFTAWGWNFGGLVGRLDVDQRSSPRRETAICFAVVGEDSGCTADRRMPSPNPCWTL
jgi:hypothetical protein